MKKLFNKKLWLALSPVFLVLFVVFLAGTIICNYFFAAVNAYFEAPTFYIKKGNASDEERIHYPDEWEGYDDWFSAYEQELCERTEAEGAVLLKNENNALPLAKGSKVSLFSRSSVDLVYIGTGSGAVDTSTSPNLRKAMTEAGFEVNEDLWKFYNTGAGSSSKGYKRQTPALDTCGATGEFAVKEVPWNVYTEDVKSTFATYGDAAIVVFARSGGEGADLSRTGAEDKGSSNGNYLALTDEEKDLLAHIKQYKDQGTIKKVVVLLNSSNPLDCNFIDNEAYGIDACLWIGGPGAYGINAVADILCGDVNPSGRLPDTYLNYNLNNPSVVNFGDFTYTNAAAVGLTDTNDKFNTNVNYVVYQEGIYVGYKYYETRYADVVMGTPKVGTFDYDAEVYRPFGYGDSYTTFKYSNFDVKEVGVNFEVTVTVTNTGNVAGKHAVEIYMQKPYSDYDKEHGVEKSAIELVGFEKTGALRPNASETVTVTVPKELMKSYDANFAKTYILDKGEYYLTVGTDSHDAVNNVLTLRGFTQAGGDESLAKQVADIEAVDAKIYSKSLVTGKAITNQFDDIDINKYDGITEKVTYLSRNDWEGTYPKAGIQLTATAQLKIDVLDEYKSKEGYEMPTYGAQNGLSLIMLKGRKYDDPLWDTLLDQMTFSQQEGMVVQAFHNTKAIDSIGKPSTIETNGPQGVTNSFFGGGSAMAYPAETIMCATWNKDIMAEIGENIGIQGLKSRTNGIYGPGANIHRNAYCGRNYEYFSEDAMLSSFMMASEVKAMQSVGVYAMMKHYALNDQETHRGGIMTWANEQTVRETYLAAFEYAVRDGGARGAMTVMNRVGAKWGGAHYGMITAVPRDEWGFDGCIITDYSSSSNYTSVINGLEAGVSLWDGYGYGETNTPRLSALSKDPYACTLLREAVKRVLFVQVNSSAMNGIGDGDKVVTILTWWQSALIAGDVVFGVFTAAGVAMLVLSLTKFKGSSKKRTEENK